MKKGNAGQPALFPCCFKFKLFFATIMEILLWNFLMFYQILLSPQVKRSVIISNKQGVYRLVHKLLNNLRLSILGNKEKPGKSQNLLEW